MAIIHNQSIYKTFQPRRIVLNALFLFLCTISVSLTTQVQAQEVFTIDQVEIDVTAESAVAARDQAFEEAQQKAFKMLAERLLPEEEAATFEPPAPSVISPMIKDFEITEEHLSKVRYLGTYTFRFYKDDITRFFGGRGLTFTSTISKPVLVLPFYQWGSRTVLWDSRNPWMAAWARAGAYNKGLVPVAVPIGDVQDVSDIADDAALTYDPNAMTSIISRYNAGSALIATATPVWTNGGTGTDETPDTLQIALYRATDSTPEYVDTLNITRTAEEDGVLLFDRAVTTVRKALQKDWKSRTVVDSTQSGTMIVTMHFTVMSEWVEAQKTLRALPGVQNVRILSLKPNAAQIEISYQGARDRLENALRESGLSMDLPTPAYIPPQEATPYNNAYPPYGNNPGTGNPYTTQQTPPVTQDPYNQNPYVTQNPYIDSQAPAVPPQPAPQPEPTQQPQSYKLNMNEQAPPPSQQPDNKIFLTP